MRSISSICEAIDDLIAVQVEARPRGSDRLIRLLAEEARRVQNGMTEPAATAILAGLESSGCAVVSSGWLLHRWFPNGELCGMIGAIGLARFFVVGLHKAVLFPTESELVPIVTALCRTAGLRTCEWDEFRASSLPQVCVFPYSKSDDTAREQAREIIEAVSPGALVTVEKGGPGPGGVFHAGNGVDMSDTSARLNVMVEVFRKAGIVTVGVGDLGNEIGFGKIRDRAREILGEIANCDCGCGEGIVTSVETDHLVVGSASNRAAMGLEAALGAISQRARYVRDGALDVELIRAAASLGAMDSFSVSPVPTDGHGVPARLDGAITDLLKFIAHSDELEFPLYKARKG